MIYEFTAATIKHHFPRAVLMTWRERYFIKANAPGTDTGMQSSGHRASKILSSKCWLLFKVAFVKRILDNRDTGGHKKCIQEDGIRRGYGSYRTWLIFFLELSDECGYEFESCMEGALRQKTSEPSESLKSRMAHLQMKRVHFRVLSCQDCCMPESLVMREQLQNLALHI